MSNTEKIIKTTGIVLALWIIVIIIGFIFNFVSSIFFMFGKFKPIEKYEINSDISSLKIEVASSISIKYGEDFRIETNNRYVKINEQKGNLIVEETRHIFLFNYSNDIVTIYVPENVKFDDVDIQSGAGAVVVEFLNADSLDLEVGAGSTLLENIKIEKEASIKTGAGKLILSNGEINNMNLEVGAGHVEIEANINGKSEIGVGVGDLLLEVANLNDYYFKVNKGIGEVTIGGKKMSNESEYGIGSNRIFISNGIGSVIVNECVKD